MVVGGKLAGRQLGSTVYVQVSEYCDGWMQDELQARAREA